MLDLCNLLSTPKTAIRMFLKRKTVSVECIHTVPFQFHRYQKQFYYHPLASSTLSYMIYFYQHKRQHLELHLQNKLGHNCRIFQCFVRWLHINSLTYHTCESHSKIVLRKFHYHRDLNTHIK